VSRPFGGNDVQGHGLLAGRGTLALWPQSAGALSGHIDQDSVSVGAYRENVHSPLNGPGSSLWRCARISAERGQAAARL